MGSDDLPGETREGDVAVSETAGSEPPKAIGASDKCRERLGNLWRKFVSVISWPFQGEQRIIAVTTLALACGTIALAIVSYRQIQIMKNDQRPWVGLGAIYPIGEGQGRPPTFSLIASR